MSSIYDRDGNKKLRIKIRECWRTKQWKKKVVELHGKCKKCGTIENLTSHHKVSISMLIERLGLRTLKEAYEFEEFWDLSNGECYCTEHHDEIHNEELEARMQLICIRKGWIYKE